MAVRPMESNRSGSVAEGPGSVNGDAGPRRPRATLRAARSGRAPPLRRPRRAESGTEGPHDPRRRRPDGPLGFESAARPDRRPPPRPREQEHRNRVLLLAALADGESRLKGGLESDDTVVMRRALEAMASDCGSIAIRPPERRTGWSMAGALSRPRATPSTAATPARRSTSTAALTLADAQSWSTARPHARAPDLRPGGGPAVCPSSRWRAIRLPAIRVHGGGLPGGAALIGGSRSSQYVSAVLQAAPTL